jgi:hypothetical protein
LGGGDFVFGDWFGWHSGLVHFAEFFFAKFGLAAGFGSALGAV